MPIKFRCVHCRQFLGISRTRAGHIVDCPTCGRAVRVPELDGRIQPLPKPQIDADDSELARALDELANIGAVAEVSVEQPSDVSSIPRQEGKGARSVPPIPEPEPIVVPPPLPAEPVAPSEKPLRPAAQRQKRPDASSAKAPVKIANQKNEPLAPEPDALAEIAAKYEATSRTRLAPGRMKGESSIEWRTGPVLVLLLCTAVVFFILGYFFRLWGVF